MACRFSRAKRLTPSPIKSTLVTAFKILTRGRLTLVSPFVEDALWQHFGRVATDDDEGVRAKSIVSGVVTPTGSNIWFDGAGT